jgi:hypothetical protein
LRATDASSKIKGNIQFSCDTIKLIAFADTIATEENVERMVYNIDNKDNRKYIIKKLGY